MAPYLARPLRSVDCAQVLFKGLKAHKSFLYEPSSPEPRYILPLTAAITAFFLADPAKSVF